MAVFNDYQEGKILIIKEDMATSVAFHSNHVKKKDMCTSFSSWKIQKKKVKIKTRNNFCKLKMITDMYLHENI